MVKLDIESEPDAVLDRGNPATATDEVKLG